ncbi:MAG: NfeD family protein [Bacteroidales bacterium]|nr:NfeD family protein [Candidatus Cacconaster merdequi]
MIDWWTSLSLFSKILWSITLASSLIFVIQSVLTFIGADTDGAISDFDMNMDDVPSGDGANLYTFRNLVVFCLGFGWTAILLGPQIGSTGLLMVISAVCGIGLVVAVMYIFKFLSNMQQSGTINVFKSAVGCYGTAYLKIPEGRSGEGKVQISINDSVREYNAMTDGEEIPTGAPVTVVEVLDANTLLVERQNSIII